MRASVPGWAFLSGFGVEFTAVLWTNGVVAHSAWAVAASTLQAIALLGVADCPTWRERAEFVAGYSSGCLMGLAAVGALG